MLNRLKKRNEGFTIIEVMIVLAIAGLILLIVFLAVPALQRSSRNTQRKTDIGRIGSAATTVVSNLNGQAVSAANFSGGAAGTVTTEAGSLGYYVNTNVKTALVSTVNNETKDTVTVVYGFKCNVNDASTAAPKQIAVLWASETGGADSKHCTDQ